MVWVWLGVMVALLLLAGLVLGPLGVAVYRKSAAVLDETARAGDRFAAVADEFQRVSSRPEAAAPGPAAAGGRAAAELAVFGDPASIRARRTRRGGGRHRAGPAATGRGRTA